MKLHVRRRRRGVEGDLREQLLLAQRRLEHPQEERVGLQAADAVLSGEREGRIERFEHRGVIRRRIPVRRGAADRPAVAHLRVAQVVGGIPQRRRALAERVAGGQRRVLRQRADRDAIAADIDRVELRDRGDVDQHRGRGEAQLHHRDEAVPAGEQLGVAAVLLEQTQRVLDAGRSDVVECCRNHLALPFVACIAAQSFSGLSGMSMCLMPSGESASITALTTAGVEPIVPASPMPLTPSGLTVVGVTV